MNEPIWIELQTLDREVFGRILRVPVSMSGWEKVRYRNRWYLLVVGIRNAYHIHVDYPLKRREER